MQKKDLNCENPDRKVMYHLLMMTSGMMGAYTFNLRGGIFCNAQTANFVMMAIAFGKGDTRGGMYFLIPITAYFLGAFISEILPIPVRKHGRISWHTYLILFEAVMLFMIGFIPLSMPDHIVQVLINFIASMQYNTFRQAAGIPMATTFCTNHVRQIGIACAKAVQKREDGMKRKVIVHLIMLTGFFAGGVILTVLCEPFGERSIWVALIPLAVVFADFVHEDLSQPCQYEKSGHKAAQSA